MNGRGDLVRPWFHLLVERAPMAPVWVGLGVVAGLAVLHGGLLLALYRADAAMHWASVPHRLFIFTTITGYSLWVGYVNLRSSRRDLEALRPLALDSGEFDTALGSYARYRRSGLVACSLLAPVMPLALIWIQGRSATMSLVDNVWHIAGMTLFGLVVWPTLYLVAGASRRFSMCGRHLVRVNVLDLDSLAPFARVALRSSLGILGSTPIVFVPIALAGASQSAWLASLAIFAPAVGLAFVVLLAPSWGIHRALQDAKASELGRVRGAISGDTEALRESPLARHAASLSILELLAYRDRIESLREWPFDASAVRRFGLYLLIPLASWVGAALVERLVDFVIE